MKKIKSFLTVLSTLIIAVLIASIPGCKKEETITETVSQGIQVDLFPLVVGHSISYSGFLRDRTTDTDISASGQTYSATWFVASNSAPVPTGGTSSLVYDTTKVNLGTGLITSVNPLFISRSPATGTANFSFLTNIGRFYRTFGIQRADSLRWILIANLQAGVGTEWSGFDSTWTAQIQPGVTGPVRLQIVGKFEGTETLTLAGQAFSTYKLTAKRRVYLSGVLALEAPTATFWLATNIGPVKMIINADGESYGHSRDFKSKNF